MIFDKYMSPIAVGWLCWQPAIKYVSFDSTAELYMYVWPSKHIQESPSTQEVCSPWTKLTITYLKLLEFLDFGTLCSVREWVCTV